MQQNGALHTSNVNMKVLLLCGAIAGPLFTIVWIVEGATRSNYDPLRHPISSLSIGEGGWTQAANFLVTGLLMLAFAFGLRRTLASRGGSTWGPLLIGVIALGFLGAGIFVTDPLNGYPLELPTYLCNIACPAVSIGSSPPLSSWVCPSPALCSSGSSPDGACAVGRSSRWSRALHSWSCSSSRARALPESRVWYSMQGYSSASRLPSAGCGSPYSPSPC